LVLWRVISATIVEESRPPERNAPNGTSLTICIFTASSSRPRKVSTTSSFAADACEASRSGANQ
jgi:hypothetical protein